LGWEGARNNERIEREYLENRDPLDGEERQVFKVEKIAAIGSIHAPKFTCYLGRHN
jgi:hypothetical protein